jgi:hypothetical protein
MFYDFEYLRRFPMPKMSSDDSPTERRKTGRRMTERRKTGRRMTKRRMTKRRMTERQIGPKAE